MANDNFNDDELEPATPPPSNPFAVARPLSTAMSADVLSNREASDMQASLLIAQRFPRDEAQAMDKILNSFARPSLAEKAMYQYARGGTEIEGLSIRAAEALAQGWGRIDFGIRELEQRNGESTIEAYAFDMQSLARSRKVFQVRHWRDTKKTATNPHGGYKLTDSRDIYEVTANQGARRMRACILAVIPIDVQEEAIRQINVTLRSKVEITPELITSLVEKFEAVGVPKAALEKRIQRHIDAITPAQVLQLGKIFNSIRDGFGAPTEYFEIEAEREADGGNGKPSTIEKGVAGLKEKAAAAAKEKEKAAAASKAADKTPADGKTNAGRPTVTRDGLIETMRKRTDLEVLDADATLIEALPGDERETVRAEYHKRRAVLATQ